MHDSLPTLRQWFCNSILQRGPSRCSCALTHFHPATWLLTAALTVQTSPSIPLPSAAERTIVNRERSRQGYQLLPYLLSKLAAELPISAIFPALFASAVYPATGLHPKVTR